MKRIIGLHGIKGRHTRQAFDAVCKYLYDARLPEVFMVHRMRNIPDEDPDID
jgi:hypothetical protein